MKKIFNYFSPKNTSGLKKQKTNAYIFVCIVGFFIAGLMVSLNIALGNKNNMLHINMFISMFMVASLFILKKTNIKIAGNVFSIVLVLIIAYTINDIKEGVSIYYKYLSGSYTILALLTAGALFASRSVILINSAIIIAVSYRLFSYSTSHLPEDTQLLTVGFINQLVAVVVISLVIYFTNKFTESSVNLANRNTDIKEKQNKVLLEVIDGIRQSSNEIYNASEQLSKSSIEILNNSNQQASISTEISSNANEQATTIEEISESIYQMLLTISANTESAENTNKKSKETVNRLQGSNAVVIETIDLVDKISNEISVISKISEKTNILAINAAIEAARAGKAGKGFAIVSQEIRKLAKNSKDISTKIEELSSKGKNISQIARKSLETSLHDIEKGYLLIENITETSLEQKEGVALISNSMNQLSSIANKNTSSSTEMSANAKELSAQSYQLIEQAKKMAEQAKQLNGFVEISIKNVFEEKDS